MFLDNIKTHLKDYFLPKKLYLLLISLIIFLHSNNCILNTFGLPFFPLLFEFGKYVPFGG